MAERHEHTFHVTKLKAPLIVCSAINNLVNSVDERLSGLQSSASQKIQVTGGRQALKKQIQSLKTSLLNQGQREAFTEGRMPTSRTTNKNACPTAARHRLYISNQHAWKSSFHTHSSMHLAFMWPSSASPLPHVTSSVHQMCSEHATMLVCTVDT